MKGLSASRPFASVCRGTTPLGLDEMPCAAGAGGRSQAIINDFGIALTEAAEDFIGKFGAD